MLYSVIKSKYSFVNNHIEISNLQDYYREISTIASKTVARERTLPPVLVENLLLDTTFYALNNEKWLCNAVFQTFFQEYLVENFGFESDASDRFVKEVCFYFAPETADACDAQQKEFIKTVCARCYDCTSHYELMDEICISSRMFARLKKNIHIVLDTMQRMHNQHRHEKTFVGGLDKIMIEAILEYFQQREEIQYRKNLEAVTRLAESMQLKISGETLARFLIAVEIVSVSPARFTAFVEDGVAIPNLKPTGYPLDKRLRGCLKASGSTTKILLKKLQKQGLLFPVDGPKKGYSLMASGVSLVCELVASEVNESIRKCYQVDRSILDVVFNYCAEIQAAIVRRWQKIDPEIVYNFVAENQKKLSFEALGEAFVILGILPDDLYLPLTNRFLDPGGLSYLRACICQGLAKRESEERIKVLATLVKFEKKSAAKIAAIDALGTIGSTLGVPLLHQAKTANRENIHIQNAIQNALIRLQSPAAP